MKKLNIMLLWVLAIAVCGCSKDYLNTEPTSSISGSAVFETTDNAKMVINGMNKLMCKQWFSSQGWNGQGTTMLYYGEYPGDGMYVANLTSWNNVINGEYHTDATATYSYRPWHVYYMIIGNANSLINNIDLASGTDADKAYLKAQALSYRAYCYYYLTQLYCKRWKDSSNGASDGVVLRLDESTGDMALSTLGKCYEQMYQDLNDAIENFKESGKDRSENWEMGLNVAYAIFSRVALSKQDYDTAITMSQNARKGYPLMSVADYKSGFCTANDEWIWYLVGLETETLYYYSYQAYVGYNASASQVRNYPKCISRELFDKLDDNDIRKGLFLNPGTMSYTKSNGFATSKSALDKYGREFASADGRKGILSTFKVFAYMQFKLATAAQPGIGDLPLFRSSEMILNEAEAQCKLGNNTAAQNLLVELNATSGRLPGYTCAKEGDDLFEEIKLYRKIELWGEGFNWFDLKRWGDSLVRHANADGGNYMTANAVTYGPNDKNEWVWVIPQKEKDYNHAL